MTYRICACMGPVHGEPYCPCGMEDRGLPPSEARLAEEAGFKEFVESGGLDELFRKGREKPGQTKPQLADASSTICSSCNGSGWVCEAHPERASAVTSTGGCQCDAAAQACDCNPNGHAEFATVYADVSNSPTREPTPHGNNRSQ
jgi:hypothetical protein